ncbi:MAG: hypothetical protein CMP76_07530 [Flavobacterium sp.]|uniref:hypothetical protein n=1 Tax=Flavobacterium sp. TaxID=239 RepID=UPI000C651C85|nr:hypothetical protein [Flavobacterium sp.]MBF03132.1 hypothetical protein [Flavobacterium sp.]|tara:strand:- start:558 stop:1058 length:501 start_codon:yes stop_codon:yes gene_type:complete
MKNRFLIFIGLFTIFVFGQNPNNSPTTELYGYYQKEQNFKTIHPKIEEYEALMLRPGFRFLRTAVISEQDYKLVFSKKYEDGFTLKIQIHYQFMKSYFRIKIEKMEVILANGDVMHYTENLSNQTIKNQYEKMYQWFVMELIKKINPLKTFTKEEFQQAINNNDKL